MMLRRIRSGIYAVLECGSLYFASTAHADNGLFNQQIWDACWAGDSTTSRRKPRYPHPITVTVRNRGSLVALICVFDNRCPYTLFKGRLKPGRRNYLSACADDWERGSVTLMNSAGRI